MTILTVSVAVAFLATWLAGFMLWRAERRERRDSIDRLQSEVAALRERADTLQKAEDRRSEPDSGVDDACLQHIRVCEQARTEAQEIYKLLAGHNWVSYSELENATLTAQAKTDQRIAELRSLMEEGAAQ